MAADKTARPRYNRPPRFAHAAAPASSTARNHCGHDFVNVAARAPSGSRNHEVWITDQHVPALSLNGVGNRRMAANGMSRGGDQIFRRNGPPGQNIHDFGDNRRLGQRQQGCRRFIDVDEVENRLIGAQPELRALVGLKKFRPLAEQYPRQSRRVGQSR